MNKYTFGLSNVHIAWLDEENDTKPAWGTPIAIPGAVKISLKAEGDSSLVYADNVVYAQNDTNDGYSGDIEFVSIQDTIKKDMYGWEVDDNGALVEVADAKPKKFALMGEVNGDATNRRFVYYGCQATRSDVENKTREKSTEPNIEKMNLSARPVKIGDKYVVKSSLPLDAKNKTAYDGFYESVYKPTFTPVA